MQADVVLGFGEAGNVALVVTPGLNLFSIADKLSSGSRLELKSDY